MCAPAIWNVVRKIQQLVVVLEILYLEDSCTIQQFTKSSSHLRLTNTGEIDWLLIDWSVN